MKKWLAALLCITLFASLCGCNRQPVETVPTETTVETTAAPTFPVGLCLPNQTEQRWIAEGNALKTALEAKNCEVKLENAENNVQLQAEQIEKLLKEKVECLIVAAVDSASLSQSLAQAKTAGIPVIVYDRLLLNTDAVTGYVGFDYKELGITVAQEIISAKGLETAKAEKRSYSIEFLMDTYQNHSNVLFFQGLMQELKTYLDTGVLVCKSGRVNFEDVCVKNADLATAKSLCEEILKEHYKETQPAILVTGNDILADGWVETLKAQKCPAESWPLIAGQNATEAEVTRIVAAEQLLTVYFDRTALAQACANAVEAVLAGKPVDTKKVENGATQVPAKLLQPDLVTAENYKALLVDTGIMDIEEPAQEETVETQENPDA